MSCGYCHKYVADEDYPKLFGTCNKLLKIVAFHSICLIRSRQIPSAPSTGTITGTVIDNSTGSPLQGAEVLVTDFAGNTVTGITDGNGNFQIEAAAGENRINNIVFNGATINISEIVINVAAGQINNIGMMGVDRIWTSTF